ncbi:NAD(P)H-dependent oxidoreductase [Reichenbachiella agarivorans]|uniref:NAD(P)H-dependent oxidoreductase n=1 Tax=Reichenbachiella agarivorans TaxID=2979464 RepID=A0ABY6CS75_9BACT|nr:NAD(P)H-dependent oxidoreductase [Reichenbachiella agarivorans]UXP33369.1 NAD(P)H-dependent oxidoreductase [Reichenbachiella agarivorans]
MTKEEILSAFRYRHACKEFDTNKIIPKEDFDFILETARLSPSSFGLEPWHFVVVQDPALREALKENAWGAPKKLDTASHFLLGLTMKSTLMKWDTAYLQDFMRRVQDLPEEVIQGKSKFIEQYQKSDFELTDDRRLFDWAAKQSYIAMGNMMTAAAMIGIDSCPIEGFKQETTEQILKDKLGIDTDKYGISYMLAFGYRVVEPREKTRRCIDEVVTWK